MSRVPFQNRSVSSRALWVLLAVVVALFLGTGLYTLQYAQGLSYLSNDPKACINCHVMQEQYDGWLKSSHHAVATCNDCHAPHDFVGKYLTKAENGFYHSLAFTLQNFHEPIRIREKNARILNRTCQDCHATLVAAMTSHPPVLASEESNSCTRCHATVGHGVK